MIGSIIVASYFAKLLIAALDTPLIYAARESGSSAGSASCTIPRAGARPRVIMSAQDRRGGRAGFDR